MSITPSNTLYIANLGEDLSKASFSAVQRIYNTIDNNTITVPTSYNELLSLQVENASSTSMTINYGIDSASILPQSLGILNYSGSDIPTTFYYQIPGSGSVSSVNVISQNGLAGTVANPTSTPAITLSTTVSGILKGNGTAILTALPDVDYQYPVTYSDGLVLTGRFVTVNNNLNIERITNLSTNGYVTTTAGNGTLVVGSGPPSMNQPIIFNASGNVTGIATGTTLLNPTLTIAPLAIGNAMIQNSAIATNNIQSNAITNAKINTGAVTTTKIADNAVTTVNIASGAVTNVNLAPSSVNNINIVDDSVTYSQIQAISPAVLLGNPFSNQNIITEVSLGDGLFFNGTSLNVASSATTVGIDFAVVSIVGSVISVSASANTSIINATYSVALLTATFTTTRSINGCFITTNGATGVPSFATASFTVGSNIVNVITLSGTGVPGTYNYSMVLYYDTLFPITIQPPPIVLPYSSWGLSFASSGNASLITPAYGGNNIPLSLTLITGNTFTLNFVLNPSIGMAAGQSYLMYLRMKASQISQLAFYTLTNDSPTGLTINNTISAPNCSAFIGANGNSCLNFSMIVDFTIDGTTNKNMRIICTNYISGAVSNNFPIGTGAIQIFRYA